jgi:hypothetical protein
MTDKPDEIRRDDTAYTKLTTKLKRGTDVRDQDTTKIVTRHPDPKEAAVRHQQALGAVRSAANTARSIDPEESE